MRRLFDELPTYGGSSTGLYPVVNRPDRVATATTWEELDKHYQATAPKQERDCNHD